MKWGRGLCGKDDEGFQSTLKRKGLGLASKIDKLLHMNISYMKTKNLRNLCIALKVIPSFERLSMNYLLLSPDEMAFTV